MKLREPPRAAATAGSDRSVRLLLLAVLIAVLGVGVLVLTRGPAKAGSADPERTRELATKLKAAGALDEAALHYERYLEAADLDADAHTRIAYSLGSTFLERGDYDKALRWFYEAEMTGSAELSDELGRKVVHTLERLGRTHAAQAALEERVAFTGSDGADPSEVRRSAADPVVARIGEEEIYRSDVDRALGELPPELVQSIRTPQDRQAFVRQYVAEELLWRRARKLEYDRDEEVLRQHESSLKRLAVSRLVEDEVIGNITVDEADLRNFFEANRERYEAAAGEGGEPRSLSFEEARPVAEREYRMSKMQSGYQSLVESELAAGDVEIFAERMEEGS
jgi:tetratricopeptide (TPR) repeat protein